MLVNKSNLLEVFRNLKAIFNNTFQDTKTTWARIAMEVPSTGSENNYKWLSRFPRMRRWIGSKVIKALEGFKYTIVNDDWETTIEVNRNDIQDDNLGIYAPQARMAGWSAAQLPDEIVYELVNDGFKNRCYDGQYFFDTDHPVGEKLVSNKTTKALDISTLAGAKASFGAARTAMMNQKDEDGRPLNIIPDVWLVPAALQDDANLLMTVDRLEDGKPNPYKGVCEVVVDGHLTSDTAWFLLDTKKPVKPFILQKRQEPEFVQQTDMNSDNVFLRKQYLYGAEARMAGGYAFWQLAYGSTGTE